MLTTAGLCRRTCSSPHWLFILWALPAWGSRKLDQPPLTVETMVSLLILCGEPDSAQGRVRAHVRVPLPGLGSAGPV